MRIVLYACIKTSTYFLCAFYPCCSNTQDTLVSHYYKLVTFTLKIEDRFQIEAVESGFYRCVGRNTDAFEDTSAYSSFFVTGDVVRVVSRV